MESNKQHMTRGSQRLDQANKRPADRAQIPGIVDTLISRMRPMVRSIENANNNETAQSGEPHSKRPRIEDAPRFGQSASILPENNNNNNNNSNDVIIVESPEIRVLNPANNPMQLKTEPSIEPIGKEILSLSDHQKLLEAIENLILTMDLTIPEDIETRIRKTIKRIKNCGNREQSITGEEIRIAASSCILQITKSAKLSSIEGSVSLKEFLMLLHFMFLSLKTEFLSEIEENLKKLIREAEPFKRVPLTRIRSALETVIDIIAP